jgi:hypothetical protein
MNIVNTNSVTRQSFNISPKELGKQLHYERPNSKRTRSTNRHPKRKKR